MSTNNVETIVSNLVDVANSVKLSTAAIEREKAKSGGFYDQAISIVVEHTESDIRKAFEVLVALVQTDGRVAAKVGAKPRDKETKDGKKYKLPRSLSSAKTVILGSLDRDVPFFDEDGELRSFSGLRKALSEKIAADEEAALTDDERAHRDAMTALATAYDRLVADCNDATADYVMGVVVELNYLVEDEKAESEDLADLAEAEDLAEAAAA